MGQKTSAVEVRLTNDEKFPALDLDTALCVVKLKHPAAWDSLLRQHLQCCSEAVEGRALATLMGTSISESCECVIRSAPNRTATFVVDLPPREASPGRVLTVVAVMVPINSSNSGTGLSSGCCAAPRRRLWVVPQHLAVSQDALVTCGGPALSRCMTCGRVSDNGLQYVDQLQLLRKLCRSGTPFLHRVASTTCRSCLVHSAFKGEAPSIAVEGRNVSSMSTDRGGPACDPEQGIALIVVPEKLCREKLRVIAVRHNLIPTFAIGAPQALAQLRTNPNVVVVICDVILPGMSGLELIGEIRRAVKPSPPIIAVGGSESFSELALLHGSTAFHLRSAPDADFRVTLHSIHAMSLRKR